MRQLLLLALILKVTNGFFFVDPSLSGRPVFDNRFWKNFENGMKKLEDTLRTTSHDVESAEEDTIPESSEDMEVSHHGPHDPFNMFPFFGMTPARPWWMGKNVCVTKEETDLAAEEEESNMTSSFGMSTRMETCSGAHGRYTCTTTIHGVGKHKTISVKYECCHGFALKGQKCVQVKLLNFTEAAREVAPEFTRMLETTGLLDKMGKSEDNFTLFVTADQALDDLRDNFDQMNQLELLVAPARRRRSVRGEPEIVEVPQQQEQQEGRASSKDMAPALNNVLQNHIVKQLVHSADFVNNKMLKSMSGDELRLNVYPGGLSAPVLTVNCKRLVKADMMADKGLVHVLDGVLKPVERSVAQIIQEDDRFSIFRSMLEEADLMDRLTNDTITVFAPTDEAFSSLPDDFRISHSSCNSAIARHHVTPHMLCMSGLVDTWAINTLSGERIRMERSPEGVTVAEKAKISLADVVGTNGVVHVLDSVLLPDAARKLNEVLENRNLTTFQKLLAEAGIANSEADLTWFAPREEAFSDPQVQKTLEEARADPEKLRALLMYHSSQPQIDLTTLEDNQDIVTRAGDQSLHFNMYSEGPSFGILPPRATVNCARVRITDNKACGVNVHEIDRLLVPPTGDVLLLIKDKPEFSILNKVIERAGLEEEMKGLGVVTLLAPTDDAFNDLPARVLNALLANQTQARQVLEKHILPESICCHGVAGQSWLWTHQVTAKDGSRLQARRDGFGNVHFGRTRVTQCDQMAINGIVHTVSRVLVPREDQHNPFAPFMNSNGWRVQGQNPNVDVMLFGI